MAGFIKIHRQITEWEWYTDIPVRILFEHCLFKANFEDKKWQGIIIKRGSFVTSYGNLAFETGLSVQQVRTAIDKLKSTGEVTYTSTSRYSMITVNNWEKYQTNNTQDNNQITNEQQTNNNQITTTSYRDSYKKNEKNIKNEEEVLLYGEYKNVSLSKEHYGKLLSMCASEKLLNELVNSFSVNIEVGKERPYIAELPNAHYERLKAYYNYRKKNPDKFSIESKEDVWEKLAEKYKDLKV